MNLTGRTCPKCSRLMERQKTSTQKVAVMTGFFVKPDIGEICPVCGYESPLHLHMYSNNVASGQRFMFSGQYQEAEKCLLEAHEFYPALDSAHVLALLYSEMRNLAEAEKWFKEGVRLFDDWPATDISTRQDFLVDYGFFLGFELKRHDQMINILLQAISMYERNYKAHYNLGSAYARSEDWGKAEACYKRALEINPNHEGSRISLKAIQQIKK